MNHQKQTLAPGLWLVGVPIGTARDITLRALDVLASADMLAAEDTRSLRKLMDIHGVPLAGRPVLALHDHSKPGVVARLVAAMQEGRSVAYASEAGMPLIADPGFDLVRAARAEGLAVTSAPGASAVTTALALGGLPVTAFHFSGFLPNAKAARRAALSALAEVPGTLVFYESPKRLAAMLADAAAVLGADRVATVCRELTKKFEDIRQDTLAGLQAHYQAHPPKGEIVVLVGAGDKPSVNQVDLGSELTRALGDHSMRDAVDLVAQAHALPRRQVYQAALALGKSQGKTDDRDDQ